MKCGEASWLLEVGDYGFSIFSRYLGHGFCYCGCPKPIIWQAWCLWSQTWGPFWQLGDTLGTSAGGGHMRVQRQIIIDFGTILGPPIESFWGWDGLNSMFCSGLFPGNFLHWFLSGIIHSWSSENKVFVRKVLQKQCFRKNRFLVIRGSIFCVFWTPWGWLFWFSLAWKQAWKLIVVQSHSGDPEWHQKIKLPAGRW